MSIISNGMTSRRAATSSLTSARSLIATPKPCKAASGCAAGFVTRTTAPRCVRRGSIAVTIEKISCGKIEYDVDGNIALDVKETRT
ncbi:hypothetical protein [Caballeronia cordobensis]|uniref:hypothetical protein n=1 Tax=Caballeronia cordobensis TaxID=1353886 RepID=UPI00158E7B0A